MITYQVESFTKCLSELKGLFDEHYQEIGNDPNSVELNPDYDAYSLLEENNSLHLVTVRSEGLLVGYYLSVISPMLHFKHIINAYNDAIFVKKEYRKGTVGYKLIKKSLKLLEDMGVNCVTLHTKTKQPFDKLCEKLGMTCVERNYVKYLGD